MRQKIYILLGLLLLGGAAGAQQQPIYSQYMMNPYLLNPAIAGYQGYTDFNFTAREQWLGYSDGPSTYAISGQTRILKTSFRNRSRMIKNKVRRRRPSGGGGNHHRVVAEGDTATRPKNRTLAGGPPNSCPLPRPPRGDAAHPTAVRTPQHRDRHAEAGVEHAADILAKALARAVDTVAEVSAVGCYERAGRDPIHRAHRAAVDESADTCLHGRPQHGVGTHGVDPQRAGGVIEYLLHIA